MRQSISTKIVMVLLLIAVSFGLSAQQKASSKSKKKEGQENSGINNKFQDLTARYNGYYNADLLLKQSLLKLKESNTDDYEELLNVFSFNTAEDATSIAGDMDVILKKASLAIQKHPNAKWVDDCYLLIGQANFFKGNYEEALESFQFINKRFKYGIRKADYQKKAKKEKKKGITVNIAGLSNEDGKFFDKEERIKKNEEKKKELEEERKKREEELEKRKKEKEALIKQRAKDKKALLKERAKIKKQKEIERQRKLKWKQKNIKRKRAGKPPLPYKPKYTFDKKKPKEEETKEEEVKQVEEVVEEKEEEVVEEAKEEETTTEESDTTSSEYSSFVLKEDASSAEQEVKYKDNFFSFLFHRPAKFESTVWLARTFMAMDNNEDAIAALEYARENPEMPRKFRPELNGLIAQYHLNNENFEEAYVALDRSINDSRKKSEKARYHYLQSQISVKQENHEAVVASLKKVLKTRPPYEMAFNAKLGLAKNQIKTGDKTPDAALKYLGKMLKDDKNFDNQDKIYFTMADIAIEKPDVELAFEYLKKSASNSTVNKEQKAKTYLKIADLYYGQEEFLLASAYYDSSLVYLPKDFPNYEEISVRKVVLAELAGHVSLVELEDSLQRLASLPEAVRNDIIDELIAKIEEQAEDEQAAQSVADLQNNDPNNVGNQANSAGAFYFYNPNSKSVGKIDFLKTWGERPLVDNWRRQAAIPAISSTDSADEEELKELALGGLLTRDKFISALPFSAEAKAASNKKIMESLYQIGFIYDEKLNNHEKAILAYEELLERFPETPKAVDAHFALYNIYKEEGDMASANLHKGYIKDNAADSQYADVIDGGKKEKEALAALTAYYDDTYQQYLAGNYESVFERIQQTEVQFASNNTLQPEFELLEAFAIGKTQELDEYIVALKQISSGFKGHEVQEKADEILSFIDAEKKAEAAAKSKYKFNEGILHYYVIAMDGYTKNITKAINNISDFNKANFSSDKLKVTQMLLDKDHPVILIKNFKTASNANLYQAAIKSKLATMLAPIEVPNQNFIISKPNFNTYFKDKNLDLYLEFYEENYGK